jgi:phytoene synthase
MVGTQNLLAQELQLRAGVDVARAFEVCSEITRAHSRTFFFSTRFLPAEKCNAIRAFYAFCRSTDDMVDTLTHDEAGAHLAAWRCAARMPAAEQTDPVLVAWSITRDAFGVPQQYVEELIDGCEMDLSVNRYQTWEQLQRYCYCVASTVGLISMHIIGVNDDDAALMRRCQPPAIALGVALQLTNILRDVGEDLSRNRIYLPQEDLHRFGVCENDLRAGAVTDAFRALMQFEIARAHALYEANLSPLRDLKQDGRLAVGAAIMLYRAILDKIVENDFDVFQRRAHLSRAEKLSHMPAIMWQVFGKS